MLAQTGEIYIYIVGGTNALCTVIKDPTACPWDPGVCNKDVEVPAELLRNQVDVLCDIGLVRDVDFIRLAYARGRASVGKTNAGSQRKKEEKKKQHGFYAQVTPHFSAMACARSTAFALVLYHIATLAPDSAKASATARPIPAPAPETMAVLPFSENSGSTGSPSRGTY